MKIKNDFYKDILPLCNVGSYAVKVSYGETVELGASEVNKLLRRFPNLKIVNDEVVQNTLEEPAIESGEKLTSTSKKGKNKKPDLAKRSGADEEKQNTNEED